MLAEQGLRRGANGQALGQTVLSAKGDPRTLGRKALHVILLLGQKALGNKHRHIYVLMTQRLKASVQILLNVFPNRIAVGAKDHTTLNAGVVHQLCFFHHVGIPLCKIGIHGRDLFNHFLIVCH